MSASGPPSSALTGGDDTVTIVRGLAHTGPPSRDEPDEEAPRFLGRYVIIDELGAGGMGQVFRAYDPKLDRDVALKLLRRVTRDARLRLLREAQAMAKLSHPNVLPVYDVATEGTRLFLAMELVRGRSVRQWLDAAPHTVSEVLAVLVPAGRGLVAAHEAGLVHRDFKPGNVLLGDDGRVRVMDFGLARGTGRESESIVDRPPSHDALAGLGSADHSSPGDGSSVRPLGTDTQELIPSLSDDLTQMGTVVGTPMYMAPEQHLGRTADHRCDQYGFCVTLWEALYGHRPFSTRSPDDWYRIKATTRPRVDPERAVPRWLHAVMLRGLAPDPAERYPSMNELLAALTRDRQRRRQRYLAAGALVLGLGGTAAGLHQVTDVELCRGAQDKLSGIWDDATQTKVEQAVLATSVGYAAATWERVAPQLDRYAEQWEAAHEDACQATLVRHEQPEALMDARMRCLEGRRRGLRALVRTLEAADPKIVERAVSAAGDLPQIEPCADPSHVLAQAPPPSDPAVAAEVEAIDEELARIKASVDAGQAKAIEDDARALVKRAEALGHGPSEAWARYRMSTVDEELGHYESCEYELEQAYFLAQRENIDRLQAMAATSLIYLVGVKMGHPEQSEPWDRFARATLARVPDPLLEASYLSNTGLLANDRSQQETAITQIERALALREQHLGPEHPLVAVVLNNLALAHDALGHFDEAVAINERALAIREHALGPEHPHVGSSLLNLAGIHALRADHALALELQLRALSIFEGAYGRQHPMSAGTLVNLATSYEMLGRLDEALVSLVEALPILEQTQGAHHPNVTGTLINLGNLYRTKGDRERALEHYERALEILEKSTGNDFILAIVLANMGSMAIDRKEHDLAFTQIRRALVLAENATGPRHPLVAMLQASEAVIRSDRGEHAEALRLHRQALEVRRELLGPQHPDTAASLEQLGEALIAAGTPADAIAPLEEAIGILREHDDQAAYLENTRFTLARAWWDADVDRSKAYATALAARDALREPPGEHDEILAEIDPWLETHAAPPRRG